MHRHTMSYICVCMLLVGCNDRDGQQYDPPPEDAIRRILLIDAAVPVDAYPDIHVLTPSRDLSVTRPIDASLVDLGPPIVCARFGLREPCVIQGLEGMCAEGERTCFLTSWSQCQQFNNRRVEICDGLDSDCDGNTDEGLTTPCYTGQQETLKIGLCHGGISACTGQPQPNGTITYGFHDCVSETLPVDEICDGLDNDCDGDTDEGVLNACELCGELPNELCDFIDNDCDGVLDEDAGNCECGNPLFVPQPEVCNGVDDDCDNLIDEGDMGGPLTSLCRTDPITGEVFTFDMPQNDRVPPCRSGVSLCDQRFNADGEIESGYYECLGEIAPSVERCNEIDDDCDGDVDEGFENGQVSVMMIVDVSGSMNENELRAAFDATDRTVRRMFQNGLGANICYLLAVVGSDEIGDPYLFNPAHNCVPGLDAFNPDMLGALDNLALRLRQGQINRGGGTENTLDALTMFAIDDLVDFDMDGVLEDPAWSTNNLVNNVRTVDLVGRTVRVAVIIGDEPAQGQFYTAHDAARAVIQSETIVFIIAPPAPNIRASYQPVLDVGATYLDTNRNDPIEDAMEEALQDIECIANQ